MKIFRAYDIRGKYPKEINEKIAFKIGSAFGKFIKGDKIVIGRDARESSPSLRDSLVSGLCSSGKKVLDIGLSTTPMCYFAINELGENGGIMITASHNPAEYNGFKLEREKATSLSYETGIKEIEEMVKKEKYEKTKPKAEKIDIKKKYIDLLLKNIEKNKINIDGKVVVDTGNGMSGLILDNVLKKLDVDYIPLYFDVDCSFPNHQADPLVEKNLKDLKKTMKEKNAILGIAFDGDGDRVIFVDENKKTIAGDFITALISKDILKKNKEKIVYDLRSSKVVPEKIKEWGGIPIKSRIGHSYIKQKMREEDIVFGGEVSGHYYFRKFFYSESSIFAVGKILKLISNDKKISKLTKPFKKYYRSGEINFKVKNKKEKIKEAEDFFSRKGGKISKLDGITLEFGNWWFNLRPSNTEDLLRLNLEAKSKKLLEEKLKEMKEVIG